MSFDFAHAVQAPFRMQPGLRRLEPGASQLTPNRPGDRHLHEKLAVLSAHAGSALVARPGFDAAPALDALARHAAAEQPDAWAMEPGDRAVARWLGWSECQGVLRPEPGCVDELGACLHALPPGWRRAALLALAFAEDFAIVDGRDATIPWLAVALPSHWAPEQKVGRHFAEVHAPVADNRLLIQAGEHLLRLVTGSERWERYVWTITRRPGLHAHPARADAAPWPARHDADQIAADAWFRTERQTFIPVSGHRQAVFTILVETHLLTQVIDSPARATAVHDALATMSAAVLEYRSLTPVRDRLLQWLAARAVAPTGDASAAPVT